MATSAHLAPVKAPGPTCRSRSVAAWPRRTAAEIVRRAPWVDVVFGTHNVASLPVLLERARVAAGGAGRDPRVPRSVSLDPAGQTGVGVRRLGRDQRGMQQHVYLLYRAFAARHREGPPARRCAGRDRGAGGRWCRRGDAARPERQLVRRRVRRPVRLRQAAARVRRDRRSSGSGSPAAPRDFTDDVIAAMAENGERHAAAAHAPAVRLRRGAQGDEAVVPARAATSASSTGARAMPEAAITTDIIVGFPGETGSGLRGHVVRLVREAWFSGAYTFLYSKRPGTPAAGMAEQLPHAVVQERDQDWWRW